MAQERGAGEVGAGMVDRVAELGFKKLMDDVAGDSMAFAACIDTDHQVQAVSACADMGEGDKRVGATTFEQLGRRAGEVVEID